MFFLPFFAFLCFPPWQIRERAMIPNLYREYLSREKRYPYLCVRIDNFGAKGFARKGKVHAAWGKSYMVD